jgi:ankyrin repeat protein
MNVTNKRDSFSLDINNFYLDDDIDPKRQKKISENESKLIEEKIQLIKQFVNQKVLSNPKLTFSEKQIRELIDLTVYLKGLSEEIKKIVVEKLKINEFFEITPTEQRTLVHTLACKGNPIEMISLFKECGADFNIQDTFWGNTPLMWAIANANNEIALEIINQVGNTALFNRQDKLSSTGNTALHLLIGKGYETLSAEGQNLTYPNKDLVEQIVKKGGGINIANQQGYTALHLACLRRDYTMLTHLLTSQENPNFEAKDADNNTPNDLLVKNYQYAKKVLNLTVEEDCYILNQEIFEDKNNLEKIKELIKEKTTNSSK